jgi:nucleotide-binding universal stress UspA family protein
MVPPGRLLDEVVVGLDGAERSQGALEWIAQVVPDGGTIHAVHAVRPESHPEAVERRGDIEGWSDQIRSTLTERGSTTTVVPHLVEAATADALLTVARRTGAHLIVVGSHRQAFEHPKLLGRTVGRLVHDSSVPLVIVGPQHAAGRTGMVVAGVGTGETTNCAVAWAAAFAEQHRAGLALVRAIRREPFFTPEGVLSVIAWYLDPATLGRWALEDLQRVAHQAQDATESEIGIEWSAPVGKLGPELVEASEGADVLVIGRPERGPGVDQVVPPWLHHAIAHAPCPVVIVPAEDG